MHEEPQSQHRWLKRMVGRWAVDFSCPDASGENPQIASGVENVRMLGDLWIVGEAEMVEKEDGQSLLTIGFDPRRELFIGTFVASMMTHMWIYEGSLDSDGRVLTLATEGPHYAEERLARYEDIFEFVDDDHRTLTSRVLEQDGTWKQVVTASYRRI